MAMRHVARRVGIVFWILITASIPLLFTMVSRKHVIIPPVGWLIIFFGWCLLCTAINMAIYSRGSLLYPLRFIEYSAFLVAGAAAWHGGINFLKLIAWLFGLNAAVILLQYAGLMGGFSSAGYVASVAERPIGLTGGPWEVGVLIDFVFAWFICYERRAGLRAVGFAISVMLVLITGARMPLLALLVITALVIIMEMRRNPLQMPVAILLTLAIGAALVFVDNPLTSRSEGLFSSANVSSFMDSMAFRGRDTDFDGFPEFSEVEDGDASWMMRVLKWSTAITIFMSNESSFLIGLGHGIWGPALDGGFLRLITEGGFLALALFYFGWIKILNTRLMWLCLVAFSINMVMIDVYLSYKIMAMMYFMAGYFWNLGLRNRAMGTQT